MVRLGLVVTCTVDQIDELYTCGDEFEWNLKLQCRSCNEIDSAWHALSEKEKVQGRSGPASFNFQMKCKFCGSVFTIDVVPDSVKKLKANDNGIMKGQTIAIFDCRGVEPVDFDPQSGWMAKNNETGSEFTDVDFTDELSWAGYDEKGKFPVSIDEFKSSFIRV